MNRYKPMPDGFQYGLRSNGVNLQRLALGVADHFGMNVDRLFMPGRYPEIVKARSIVCHLAVRELGLTATERASQMGLSQPAISMAVERSEGILRKQELGLDDFLAWLMD